MSVPVLMLLLGLGAAHAGDAADTSDGAADATGVDAKQAEYIRLSQELEKLATRNAWAGVERTYGLIVQTGVTPSFQDHVFGAHAARAVGDVTSARSRLLKANEIKEDREVLDWLWEIDSNYGLVTLLADRGSIELKAEVMPFEPDQAMAVQFAQGRVTETGEFEGYLPQGKYWFGPHEVVVQPRVQAMRIDMRTDGGLKSKARKEKKGKKD